MYYKPYALQIRTLSIDPPASPNKDSYNKRTFLALYIITGLLVFILMQTLFMQSLHADNLTDIVYTDAFKGSFKWLSKIAWIGKPLQGIVSIFSFIGMFFILLQMVLTLAYLANKSFWDTVSEIKNETSQDTSMANIFGLKSYAEGFIHSKSGTGLDSVIYLMYIFVPDILRYSDFSEGNKESLGLQGDENIATWFLKTFPRKALIMFFLAMGFNGVLMQGYATIVDGMGAFAERIVSYNLAGYVNKVLDSGSDYAFSVGHKTGNLEDSVQGKVAKDIYSKVLSKIAKLDPDTKVTIGKAVEKAVVTNVNLKTIKEQLGNEYANLTEADLAYVNHQVILSEDSGVSSSIGVTIPASELGLSSASGNNYSAHIIFTISGRADTNDYFQVDSPSQGNLR